jgi:hypothetical protein
VARGKLWNYVSANKFGSSVLLPLFVLLASTFSGVLKYSTVSVSGLLNIKGQGHEIGFKYSNVPNSGSKSEPQLELNFEDESLMSCFL